MHIASYWKRKNYLFYTFFASLETNSFTLCLLGRGERGEKTVFFCIHFHISSSWRAVKNISKERVICVWRHLTRGGGGWGQKGERENPFFLIPAGASSPQLLGESAEANEIGTNV